MNANHPPTSRALSGMLLPEAEDIGRVCNNRSDCFLGEDVTRIFVARIDTLPIGKAQRKKDKYGRFDVNLNDGPELEWWSIFVG